MAGKEWKREIEFMAKNEKGVGRERERGRKIKWKAGLRYGGWRAKNTKTIKRLMRERERERENKKEGREREEDRGRERKNKKEWEIERRSGR